jgi:hypothetical protein
MFCLIAGPVAVGNVALEATCVAVVAVVDPLAIDEPPVVTMEVVVVAPVVPELTPPIL